MRFRIVAFALLGLAACVLTLDAQVTKKKKDEAAGVVEIYKNKDGAYRYRIKGADGKTIAMPLPQMSWDKKSDLIKALDELKTILSDTKPVEIEEKKTDEKKTEVKKTE